ncbi:MAG TPA: endonuclease domain-containing protein [Pirellulales bacterium]|nr:endonuclease domain-containing protein [Pirellulales bacterium]
MNKSLPRAKKLRRSLTDTERFVWSRMRGRRFAQFKFRRQVPLGEYIVDFVCFKQRLIIELDGGQHSVQQSYDAQRTCWLESQGFAVLRFWNHDVLQDWDTVAEVIWQKLQTEPPATSSRRTPHPRPLSHKGRGEKKRN